MIRINAYATLCMGACTALTSSTYRHLHSFLQSMRAWPVHECQTWKLYTFLWNHQKIFSSWVLHLDVYICIHVLYVCSSEHRNGEYASAHPFVHLSWVYDYYLIAVKWLKCYYSVHLKFSLYTYWVNLQKWFPFEPGWPSLEPLMAKNENGWNGWFLTII